MKKIKYEFADGIREIEVMDECAEVYESILRYEKKVERKETRRHISYDALIEAGFEFEDEDANIERVLEKQQ